MTFDSWRASGPHDDMPSTTSERCSRCREPYAWMSEDMEPLCEEHASQYLRDEKARDEAIGVLEEERAERESDWREAG